jgi:hypothetical protein
MTLAALRLSSGTPTSARSSSIQMACFPSSTVVTSQRRKKEKESSQKKKVPKRESPSPKHFPAKTSQDNTDTHHFLTNTHTQIPRELNLVTALPSGGGRGRLPLRSRSRRGPPRHRRPTARRPPIRGRAVKRIGKSSPGWMVFPQPPELPLRKRGVRCVGRGGVRGHRVSSLLMNPGPYWPLYLWGLLVGRLQTNRPLPSPVKIS